jgi:spore photoproduct lyase
MKEHEYADKLETFRGRTQYERLTRADREAVHRVATKHRLTFQEFREVTESARDLELWAEPGLGEWLSSYPGIESKSAFMNALRTHMEAVRGTPRSYRRAAGGPSRAGKPVVSVESDKKIWGMCPVASEKTVCCNLRTIDAVENCVFGCSYCSVQTFYTDRIVFDDQFAEKIRAIDIEPGRFHHFGTGQASDALAWGNKHGILDALCDFAAEHPNVLLELKTKSDNVRYFVERDVPANVVCSWSLNPQVVIDNEEHFTAGLDRRLSAARAVADRGVGVAFHFHPMVLCNAWETEYSTLTSRLIESFDAAEVCFISMGAVTLIKPVLRSIRELGNRTRIHQMPLVPDPHGKLTCPDDDKVRMFSAMNEWLAPWRQRVFIYLCMEKAEIWQRSFGHVYDSNEEFEADFGRRVMPKLQRLSEPSQRTTDGIASR